MRKLKIALLIIVMLCLVCGTLVACNPTGGTPGGEDPVVPDDTTPSNVTIVKSSAAYAAFREAALNTYPGNYFNFGVTLGLDYVKDGSGRYYSVKFQAAIDPANDDNSQLLIELWRTDAEGAEDSLLLGFYYYDGTIVYDCTGIKKGASVVKTDDINLTAVAKAVDTALGGTSIGSLLIEHLLGIELGELGSIEGLLGGILMGTNARMITAADGTVEYQIPINLASILGVVGGLLAPGGLLASYSDLVYEIGDILGLDLSMLPAMVDTSAIYMVASVKKGSDGVSRLIGGPTFQVGLDFNTAGTSLEGSVGIIESELDINLGIDEISVGEDAPVINVRDYLVSVRGLEIDDLDEYSALTLELGLELNLDLKKNSFQIKTVLDALGSVLGDVSIPDALKTMNIDIAEDTSLTLALDISAEINMRDPAQTNLLVTITRQDGRVRGTVAYVGSEQALFADLSGILGRDAKIKVSDFNLNEFLSEQIDSLLITIRDAIADLAGSAQQSAQAEYDAAVTDRIANGEVIQYYVASASDDEPANLDTVGLIQALLGAIEIDMNGDIFNIEGIGVTLTKQIINSILALAGVNGTLPLMGDIKLQYTNPGFGETKDISISGLALGIDDGTGSLKTLVDVGIGLNLRVGTIENEAAYEETLAAIRKDNADNKYANLLTFEQLLDIKNVNIADILANVGTVGIDLSLGIDINAIGGDFLKFGYDSDSLVFNLLAAFAEEGIDGNAVLKLAADVDLASLLVTDPATGELTFNAKGLLNANLYLALLTGADAEPALELWLNNGVVYLVTDLLGGMNIKVDIAPFLATGDTTGGASSAAMTAADGESSFDVNVILALLAGVGVGNTYVDVYLAAFTLTQLFGVLGFDLGGVSIGLIGEDDQEAEITGGVKVELGDGLNLGQAAIDIYLGIGKNADIALSLSGFGAGLGSNAAAVIPEDKANACVEVLENPYVYLYLEAGLDAYIAAQGISLGEDLGSIVVGEEITIDYDFEIEAYLDLRPIVAKLLGGEVSFADNRTQLAIQLSKNKGGNDEQVLIGVYYKDGRAYLDLSALGIAAASVEIDLMELIVGLAMADVEPLAGGQAYTAADPADGTDAVKAAVDLAVKIGSKGFTVTLVQGLVELLAQYVAGITDMEISALLAVDWSGAEGSNLLALDLGLYDETGKTLATIDLSFGQIGLGLGKELGTGADEVQLKVVPDDATLGAMTSIGSVSTQEYQLLEKVEDATAYAGDLYYYNTGAYMPFGIADAIKIYYDKGGVLYVAQSDASGKVSYVAADDYTKAQAAAKANKVFKDAEGKVEFTVADGITLYYADGGTLYSNEIGFNLTLPAVHVGFKGEIEMGTDTDSGVTSWSIGEWIGNFLEGTDIDEALLSFVSQLLVQFQLIDDATVKIGLDLGINIRFSPDKIDDINYILSHSDLALVVSGTGSDGVTEELLSLYVLADQTTGKSTLYLSTKEGGLIDGLKVKVPDMDLAALVSGIGTQDDTATGQALSSATADSSADGEGGTDILSVLEGILSNCIYSIIVNNSGATVNLGAALVSYVLTLIPSVGVPSPSTDPEGFEEFADSFVKLNPANSYLSLFVGENAGGLGGKIALKVGLGVDPVYLSLAIGGLNVGFEGESVVGSDVNLDEYKSIYDVDALSLDLTVDLDLTLKNTSANEEGVLDVGSMLEALIGEALIAFGVEIPKDLKLGAQLYVGANLSFTSAEDTQIVLELRDKNDNYNVLFGVYLDGPTLWIQGGVLPIGNVRIEDTGYAQLIVDTVTGLLSGLTADDNAGGSADALTAADPVAATNDAYEIFLELANERIALSITETFIVALISAIAGDGAQTATDIAGVIEKLNLGAEVNVSVDFSTFTIAIGLTSNLIDLGVSIVEPRISLNASTNVTDAIAKLDESAFNSYPETSTKVSASVDLSLDIDLTEGDLSLSDLIDVALGLDSVQAGIGGYAELITANDAVAAKNEGKTLYKYVDGVATVFDGDEAAIREYYSSTGKSLYEEGGLAEGTGKDVVTALLNSLGLEVIFTEKIHTGIGIHIDALLDLTALGDYKAVTEAEAKALLKDNGYLFQKMTDGSYEAFTDADAIASVYADGGTLYTFGALVDSIFSGDFESIFTYAEISKADAVSAGEAYVIEDGKYVALAAAEGQTFEQAVNAYEGTLYSRNFTVSLDALLAAVEAHVGLTLNNTNVDVYFAQGMLYVDLTAFGGSKIALDVMWLIDALSTTDDTASGEAMTADGEGTATLDASNTLDVILGLVNVIVKRVSLQTAIANTGGNLFKGGLSLKAMLGSELLSIVFSQLIGAEVTVEDLLFGDDANLTLKLQPQDNGNKLLELGLHAPTASGVTVDLGLGAGLKAEFATPTTTLISETERNNYTDVTGIIENILAIVNGTETNPEGSQNVMFSVMGKVYFDVNGDAVYELGDTVNSIIGSLLSVYIQNLVFNLSLDENASAGLGFRLTAGLDVAELANIDFAACKTDGALDFTKFLKAFLTEVPSLKIALELIELDENYEFAKYTYSSSYVSTEDYVVKGGIYIQNGNLYLDGTSIFGVADNYSFVPNFTKFVADLIEVPETSEDDTAAGSALSASADAYSSAGFETQRDAILQLIASSKTIEIVVTKSILSLLLVTVMPDIGDITDVFDAIDVSVGLDAQAPDEIFLSLAIGLGKDDSTQTVGLSLGGIVVQFGEDAAGSVVPAYITAQKTPDGSETVPLTPFYDSIIRLSTSIELELGVTEGTLDFGGFLKDILGDISGVVIDMPATSKGYSSANVRLDLAVMLDMYNPAQSEIYMELYNLSNEAGAEVKWLGVYYSGMTLYLDLSCLGLPRIAVPLTLISDYIDEYLGFLLDSDIYNTVVIDGGSSAEGLTAADGNDIETESLTIQEKAIKLLISKRSVVLSIGNYMLRYVLSLFDIGGKTLEDLVYDNLEGGLDLSLSYDELFNLEIGAYLDLKGDRFEPVAVTDENINDIKQEITDGTVEYYSFAHNAAGEYTLADDGVSYRLLSTSDTNANNKNNTDFPYVEPEDRYEGTALTVDDIATGSTVYIRIKGDELNLGAYDMHLALDLGIKNFELSFITEREPLLTGDELSSYMNFNTTETVTVSETISLDLLFDTDPDSDVNLADFLNYLFEGNSEAIEAFITAAEGGMLDVLNREIDVVVALEFRLSAFLNYLRSLSAQFDLRYGDARDQLLSLGESVDLITFVNAIMAVVDAKKVPDANGSLYYVDDTVDDLVGLEDLLEFVNASVRIVTNGKDANGADDGTMHDILGVYFVGGEFVAAPEGTTEQRYSNFFRSATGIYGYDYNAGEFRLISEIEEESGSVFGGNRYGYDASYMYPNDFGDYIRKDAGLYVDLSYLGQPSIYMALSELQNFIGGLMTDAGSAAEGLTAADDEEVAPPSISLGSFAESLPLISSEIASYITAFLYGIRMTSSFIQVLVQTDYINNLFGMLLGENELFDKTDNQSYLTIYTDVNNYNYTYAAEATREQIEFADSRFHINIDDANGLYYVDYDTGRLALRTSMSATEAEEYQAKVDTGEYHYYKITPIVTYINVGGEYILFSSASAADKRKAERYAAADTENGVTEAMIGTYVFYAENKDGQIVELNYLYKENAYTGDEVFFVYPTEDKNPFIEIGLYLWNHKATLSINLPETDALKHSYVQASAEQVESGIGLYEESDVYVYEPSEVVVSGDMARIYFRGAYHPVVGNLYTKGTTQYVKADNQNSYDLDGTYYVACVDNNVVYYVALTADKYYKMVRYDTVYTPVDELDGTGNYFVREARDTTNIHNPDMFVDFSTAYKVGENDVQLTSSAIAAATGFNPNYYYQYDESSDSWSDRLQTGTADHANNIYSGEEILHLWYAEGGRFVSYAEYKALNGNVSPSGVYDFYIAEPIKYVDSSELYTISLTLRGSLSLYGLENYVTLEDYAKMAGGKKPAASSRYDYNAETGVYTQSDNGEYVKVSGNVAALGDILGGIVGDLSSLLIVGDGYEAEILFEIKAQVSLEYGDYGKPGTEEVSPDTMWISEIDLAIDTWLRLEYDNGDEYLRHFIGIYYDTDPETGSSALYLDLTWLLGSGAKFRIDMSAYSLEDLIQGEGGIYGILGITSSEAEAMTAAGGDATNAGEVVLTDTDVASVILGFYTRRIVLQASAGLVRMLIGLIAPDAAETIAAVLPNVVAEVGIGLAPFDLGIGLKLYDETGDYGVLGIDITLNLFDASNRNNGTRLDLGPTEEFLETNAALLAANSSDYIFYQAMYTALLNGETAPSGANVFVNSTITAEEAENSKPDKSYVAKDANANEDAIEYVRNDKVSYNLVEEVYYSYVRADYNSRYALVPASFQTVGGSVFTMTENEGVQTFTQYNGIINEATDTLYVRMASTYVPLDEAGYYFYTYDYETGTSLMVPYTKAAFDEYIDKVLADTTKANAPASTYYIRLNSTTLGAKLYSYNGTLAGEELAAYIANPANYTKAVRDTLGAHKSESVFGAFSDLLSLDLNALLNGEEGAELGIGDIAGMLNVKDMELTLSIDLGMQFSEVVNWTQQMTELLAVDGQEKEFFKFLLQSATLKQTEFLSYIGGTLVLTAYIKGDSVKAALGGMDDMDTMTMIKTMLAGAEICIEIYYDSNYNGTPITVPLTVWVTFGDLYVSDESTGELVENPDMGAASIYIDGKDFAEFIGLVHIDGNPGSYVGNFFSKVKLENVDIFSLFAEEETAGGSAEGMTAIGGTVNDGEAVDTGLVPSNIWSYIGMALGYVMIADNTIGIGLAETLAANAVELLVSKFTGSEYLPKLSVTYDVDSSGVAIIFGDTPSIDINLGVQSGGNYYADKAGVVELLHTDSQAMNNYGLEADGSNLDSIIGAPVLVADGMGGYKFVESGADVYFLADDDYAVAAYACSEYVWLGTRYKLVVDDYASGEYHFEEVLANPYEKAFSQNDKGAYVKLDAADIQLAAFADRFQHSGMSDVTYDEGDYVALKTYLRVTGMKESDVDVAKRYNFDATKIANGAYYMKLGDLNISLSLGNLGIKVNQGAPSNPAPVDEGYTDFAKEGGVRISTALDVSFYGAEGELVDLSSLLDFIIGLIGIDGVSNNDLRLNITSELGYDENPYFNVKLDIYADIAKLLGMLFAEEGQEADTSNMLQLALSVRQYDDKGVLGGVLIGVYLVEDTLYVDLSALLGETAKVSITNLNIIDLIMGALGGEDTTVTDDTADGSAEGLTASIKDVLNATSHDYAYLGALVNPGYFSVQLTMAVVEAILGKVSENMPDKGLPTSLIDIGDIIVEAYGNRADGDMLSIGVKFSEGFAGQLAIQYLYLGTDVLSSYDGTIPDDLKTEGRYLNVFNIATGALGPTLTIGVSAQLALSMTSTGLSRDGADNYSALDSAAEAKVYGNKLYEKSGNTYILWANWDAENKDALIDSYYATGKVLYSNKYDTSLAGWAVDLIIGLLGPSLEELLGTVTSDMVNVQFAADDLNLAINLTADINIAAIMKYGLSGILFSDLKLDIQLVDFTRSLLKVYYLGSSRLTQTGNYYKLAATTKGIFADSIYVDASGLGFGLIKLSGLTGLVGGTTGGMYDVEGSTSSALTAAEGDESTSKDEGGLDISGLSLTINLANDSVGIKLEESIIEFVFGMIGGDVGQYIPDIKSLNLELAFGDAGIQSINLDGELDGAGTGLQLSLGNVNVALGGLISDAELQNLVSEVQEGYGGLAMSNTAGIMTMLQNILDTASVNLNLNIDKRGGYYATNGYNSVGWRNDAGNIVLYSRPAYATMDASGWLGDNKWNGERRLMLNLNVASTHSGSRSIDVWFGNNDQWKQNNIYITGLRSLLTGDALEALLTWVAQNLGIINVGSLIGSDLIPPLAGNDADTGSWTAPEGATAALSADGTAAAATEEAVADATTSSVTVDTTGSPYGGNQGSFHAYSGPEITDVLNGLIAKLDLNLFTSTGYMPYISGAGLGDGSGYDGNGTRFISIKITFDKVAFNELLIFLYTMILGLLQGTDANGDGKVDSGSGVDWGGPSDDNAWYFVNGTDVADDYLARHASSGDHNNRMYIISNLFRELEEYQAKPLTDSYSRQQRVQDQINVLEPYITSLPFAMAQWLIFNMLWSTLSGFSFALGALDSLFNNLGFVIGDLLPPFADMTNDNVPAPSANIYIDLSPISSTYNVSKVVAPGIQAIELMVNCSKAGYGKQLSGVNDSGNIVSSSDGVGSLSGAYVLSINPRNLMNGATETSLEGQGVLNVSESVATIIDTTAKSIVVTDPGSRAATLKSNDDGTGTDKGSGYLNSTLLSDANGFPQTAVVKIINDNGIYAPNIGANGVESSSTVYNGVNQRVDIVWDATSVDLVAATNATMNNGLRLAGYVYGYALNQVVAAIPVYITNDYAVKNVQAYVDYDGNGTRELAPVALDVSSPNGSSLPDMLYVTFENGTSYYFGTALKNAAGETYQALREKSGGALTINGVSYEAVSSTDEEGVTTITPTTYPAYPTYLVKSSITDSTATQVGDTYYKTVTYEGTSYLVLRSGISSAFPVGEFSWNQEDVSFGWEGGEIDVEFSYSWGYATETSYEVAVKVAANNVTAIETLGSNDALELNKLGNTVTLDLDALLDGVEVVDDYKDVILAAFTSLSILDVKLGTASSAKLNVEWDLAALEDAIDALAVKDGEVIKSYNFYQGFRANVTLWLGGKPVTGGKVFYDNGGLFNGSGSVYSDTAEVNYADKGYIAQAFTLSVVVGSNVVSEVESGLTFNPYADYAASMEIADFIGNEVSILFADGSTRTFTISTTEGGDNIKPIAFYVVNRNGERVVWDGSGDKPASYVSLAALMDEISYNGYTGAYGDIYLEGTIGTDIVGVQKVRLSVNVLSLTPTYGAHGYVTTSSAGTEIGVQTWYAIVDGTVLYSTDSGATYNIANGTHSFEWNFKTSINTTEKVKVNLLWDGAVFYTDTGFVNVISTANMREGSYYFAIVPFVVKDSAGRALGISNNAGAEYQTLKVQLYCATKSAELPVAGSVTANGDLFDVFVFDAENVPNTTLKNWVKNNRGEEFAFASEVGMVSVLFTDIVFDDFASGTILSQFAAEGGTAQTVSYSFTSDDAPGYTFTGTTQVYIVSNADAPSATGEAIEASVSDIRLNTLVVDPFAYYSFVDFAEAFKATYAGKTFNATSGGAAIVGTFSSLAFGSVGYAENDNNGSALPLAGGTYDVRVDFTDEAGVAYFANVRVVVLNREVASYEFVLNGFTPTVTRGDMGAVHTTTYLNSKTGAVLRIVTDSNGLPTAINILNPFAFDWDTIFGAGSGLLVTLADTGSEVLLTVANPFGEGAFEGYSPVAGYTNESLKLSFRNGDVTVPYNLNIEFTVESTKLTMYNTDLASAALDYNALNYRASVYGYESLNGEVVPSVYALLNGEQDFTWYVDGMFVKADSADTYKAMGYKLLGGENVNDAYRYNYSRGIYTRVAGGKFVFVYSAAVDMKAVWNHSALSYSFAGGIRDTYSEVSAKGTTLGDISVSVTVPVEIYSSEISEVTFTANGYDAFGKNGVDYFVNEEEGRIYFGEDASTNYFDYEAGTFYFDPLSGIDPFEQVTLTKLPVVGDMTVYRWFPLSVSVITKGGLSNANLYVGWVLSDFVFNYEGGSYKAVITLKETSMNGGTNIIPEQRFTPNDTNVTVGARKVSAVVEGEDYAVLSALTGFAGNGTYIDPYDFDIAVFRKSVSEIGSLKFKLGGTDYVFSSASDAQYKLTWDYSEFAVTYLGGVINLNALLTGPDGSTQSFAFPFLVTRVLVNQIVARKGGIVDLGRSLTIGFNTNVDSEDLGKATSTYGIDPFVPKSQSLPKGWTVNFTASNPVYSNGEIQSWASTGYSALVKDYIAVSMPKIDWTWDNVTGGTDVGYATMQIENGQRLKINVVVNGTGTSAPAYTPKATTAGSLYTLETSFDVEDDDGNVTTYSVVWVGKATVTGGSTYNVTFASAGESYTIQRKGQRKVYYTLTAYVGAVIDANGNVLVYDGNVPAALTTVTSDTYSFPI